MALRPTKALVPLSTIEFRVKYPRWNTDAPHQSPDQPERHDGGRSQCVPATWVTPSVSVM